MVYSSHIAGKTGTAQCAMTRTSITANMTAAELAAWKANNRRSAGVVVIDPITKPARKSQRQEWKEFRAETLDMIETAKRERHFHILPQLMQRLNTANTMIANHALN